MAEMTEMSPVFHNLFSYISLNPAFELLSLPVNFFGLLHNVTMQNGQNTTFGSVSVEMTASEYWFYLAYVCFWLLLLPAIGLVAITVSLLRIYNIFFVPLNRIKRLGSLGYIKGGESGDILKKDIANLIRRRRKIGEDLPPVYPNGWFRLLDSFQLTHGEVKEVCALGEHFAVYRSQSGKVNILDAYCPHLGGNMAVGGRVKGECLECPFHGWVFDKEGQCVEIPYSKKIPDVAKTKSWPCREVNDTIFVWYHCDGVPPTWEVPAVEEIANKTFKYRGKAEHHVNTHIQDIPENGSDVAHLTHLHGPSVFGGGDLTKVFDSWFNMTMKHVIGLNNSTADDKESHIMKGEIHHHFQLFKRWKLPKSTMKVYQIGPGITHIHLINKLGKGVFVQTTTPSEPLHQIFTHKLYTNSKIPLCVGKLILLAEAIQTDRDVMIWNNKLFQQRPVLTKEDKLLAQYRRWYARFYTENSPRLQMKADGILQW